MTSLCGHVKALIREWAIERMGEKHQNEEREALCHCFLYMCMLCHTNKILFVTSYQN